MAVAKLYPEPEKGGRGKKNSLKIKEFNSGYVSQARTVLKHLPVVADAVLAGTTSLNEGGYPGIGRPEKARPGASWRGFFALNRATWAD